MQRTTRQIMPTQLAIGLEPVRTRGYLRLAPQDLHIPSWGLIWPLLTPLFTHKL
jgi:hypothetical protein